MKTKTNETDMNTYSLLFSAAEKQSFIDSHGWTDLPQSWSEQLYPVDDRYERHVRTYGNDYALIGWRRVCSVMNQLALGYAFDAVVYGPAEPEEVFGG